MTDFEKVLNVLWESGIDTEGVTPRSSLVSLDIDSMDRAQLMLDLEEAFQVEIMDDDVWKLTTIQDVINYVDKRSISSRS
jgi:acyl carrier protein